MSDRTEEPPNYNADEHVRPGDVGVPGVERGVSGAGDAGTERLVDSRRRTGGSVVKVRCVGCNLVVDLPEDPDRPGFVLIAPMENWTAPPPKCPTCSGASTRDGDVS